MFLLVLVTHMVGHPFMVQSIPHGRPTEVTKAVNVTSYNCKLNVLNASLFKTFPSFHLGKVMAMSSAIKLVGTGITSQYKLHHGADV